MNIQKKKLAKTKLIFLSIGLAIIMGGCKESVKQGPNESRDTKVLNPNAQSSHIGEQNIVSTEPNKAKELSLGEKTTAQSVQISTYSQNQKESPNGSPKSKVEPKSKIVQETSDFSEFSSNMPKTLSNEKKAWYVVRNNKQQTPKIDQNSNTMMDKYKAVYVINPEVKKIYLTFDEGYENGYTGKILDTLKNKNVKASFFITGQYLKKEKGLVQRMLDEGHGVENHTMNHPSLPTLDEKSIRKEILGLSNMYKEEFGRDMKYVRPPMGEYSEKLLYLMNEMGYKTAFWGFAYDDYNVNKQKGIDYAYKMIMDNLHSGQIMLLHAVSKDNSNVLGRIIDDIRNIGYEIGKLE